MIRKIKLYYTKWKWKRKAPLTYALYSKRVTEFPQTKFLNFKVPPFDSAEAVKGFPDLD